MKHLIDIMQLTTEEIDEMIDTANEILNNTAHNDYQIFKAYRDLKKANKHYDIAIFLRRSC